MHHHERSLGSSRVSSILLINQSLKFNAAKSTRPAPDLNFDPEGQPAWPLFAALMDQPDPPPFTHRDGGINLIQPLTSTFFFDHLPFTLLSINNCTNFQPHSFFLSPKSVHHKALLYIQLHTCNHIKLCTLQSSLP